MRPRRRPARTVVPAVVLAVVVLVGLGGCARPSPGAASGPPPPGTNGAPVPALDWRPCGGSFRCADVAVPQDYRQPGGETIGLAAVRLPATDPAARIGTLAVNYGGPGPTRCASTGRRSTPTATSDRGTRPSPPRRCW